MIQKQLVIAIVNLVSFIEKLEIRVRYNFELQDTLKIFNVSINHLLLTSKSKSIFL